jgi:hypothetical protein
MNPNAPDAEGGVRPRDFALLLLASRDLAPRKRARDQQADLAGLELKKRVLTALVTLDPEPEELEAALLAVVEDLGPPTGPTRAIALALLEDWRAAVATRGWLAHLLAEAVGNAEAGTGRERRKGERDHRGP